MSTVRTVYISIHLSIAIVLLFATLPVHAQSRNLKPVPTPGYDRPSQADPKKGEDCGKYATEGDRAKCHERKQKWEERGEKAREATDSVKEKASRTKEKVQERVGDFMRGFKGR